MKLKKINQKKQNIITNYKKKKKNPTLKYDIKKY